MKHRILWSILVLYSMIAGACAGSQRGGEPTQVPTPAMIQKPTYTVQRGPVVKSIRLQGRVLPVRQQDLFFRSDGYVREVFFSSGDTVKAGDLIAELEMGELDAQLAQAELELQVAEARLAQAQQENVHQILQAELELEKINLQAVQAGALGIQPSVEAAQAYLKKTKTTLAAAEKENERLQKMLKWSAKEKEQFQRAVDRARWEVELAKQQLASAEAFPEANQGLTEAKEALTTAIQNRREGMKKPDLSPAEQDALAQALAQARENYIAAWLAYSEQLAGRNGLNTNARVFAKTLAIAQLNLEDLKSGVDLLLEIEVDQARLNLQKVQGQIESVQIAAPFDGQILSIGLAPGSRVSAYDPVLTVADPTELELAVYPSPEELSWMGIGQAAEVQLTNRPGERLKGLVHHLPIQNTTSSGSGVDASARLNLMDAQVPLTLGESVVVVIQLEAHDDVLWLPPAALRTFQGRDFVFLQEGSLQRRVDVRLGLRSDERVEILEGLVEGQVVVGP